MLYWFECLFFFAALYRLTAYSNASLAAAFALHVE